MIASSLDKKNISIIDIVVILVMAGLLYYGASWQIFATNTDAARYQCYTRAFWHGTSALKDLPPGQCKFLLKPSKQLIPITHTELVKKMSDLGLPSGLVQFVDGQSSSQPFHALPYEYPMLTLIPFTLSLLVPMHFFQIAFAFWMLVVAALVYLVLLKWRSRRAALVYAFLLVVGGWGTMAGRYDIIPSALTLFAVICAMKRHWNWAFVLLALAVLYKFYPVVLLPAFLIAQQKDSTLSWKSWRRLVPLALFVVACVIVMGVSLLLSVEGTISPFSYFSTRPIQVESLPASLLWILSHIFSKPAQYVYTYGSLNMLASGARVMSLLATLAEVVGILYVFWLQWRGKIDLATASLLTLLVVMVTGKVFSPQYLIWVVPLVAYVGEDRRWWVICWGLIGLLTTWIYPYIYIMTHNIEKVPYLWPFFPATTTRNFLLAAFVLVVLYIATVNRSQKPVFVDEQSAPALDVSPPVATTPGS
ncbi:glycosyltransferase family 87 protein [Dictyobacter aurantiacus]|uniref:DUF2029 domain-containing protein n=1 Tax=Dictyobacter aurantiacus TaxID=1936993 RepID=A0A401ZJ14_9CHLR|nr:glycosyltransferase family 87 protein [Dictyobacter aurantiacus]GCE06851.1 hypothetical protein KDAU_41800 [Dictyobacter aurantiacus]